MNRNEFINMASHFTEEELHAKAERMRERAASRVPEELQRQLHSLDDVTTVQELMQETGHAGSGAQRQQSGYTQGTTQQQETDYAGGKTRQQTGRGVSKTHLYLVRPAGAMQETLPVMINLHGGGWTMPHTERDIYFSRRMAHRLHIMVVDVDYMLAPEHPYPAALEEMDALFAALPRLLPMWRGDPDNIVLCGQSAGGNIVGAVMERKHFPKIPGIKAQILCYLPTDNFNDHFRGEELDPRGMDTEMYGFFYNRNFADRQNFDVSLLYSKAENLAGLPHTDIVTCGQDNLMPEGEKYYELLTHAGISTSYRCFEESRHGFLINLYDEYQAGEDYVAALAAKHLGL